MERCEDWCNDASHCSLCKCKGCDFCKGHHPEVACRQSSPDDVNFETCQPWCNADVKHCATCKCRGCQKCHDLAHPKPPKPCSSTVAFDVLFEDCQPWCQGACTPLPALTRPVAACHAYRA